jgi:plastocyanin
MHVRTMLGAIALVAASACSLAGGGDARVSPATGSNDAPSESTASATGSTNRQVDPRRGGLELGFGEFAITLEADEIRPGPVTFVVRNGGRLVHGFEMEIREESDNSGPGSSDDGGLKLEGPAFGPGETVRLPADLPPGVYEIECFVSEHDDMGMRTTLVVRPNAPFVQAEDAAAQPGRVEIADFAFAPETVEVQAGTEVTWSNADPTAHTVTARDGAFDSGPLDPEDHFATTFETPGTFQYFCQIHPTMRGLVRVVGSG